MGAVDIGAYESRGFTLTVTSGSGQSTPILSAFGSPLVVTVTNAFSEPVAGGAVTFTAPTSGASGSFSGSVTPVVIEAGGVATSSTFTANSTAGGPYNVVTSLGPNLPFVNFDLTNLRRSQAVTFGALSARTFGDADFLVNATATSALPVSFSASGQCTVTGATVTLNGAGICEIIASQAGDSNYSGATSVTQSFAITRSNQTVTFGELSPRTVEAVDFSVSASASSSLTVSFSATGNCTVTGATVHVNNAGSCTITASQAGDNNYNPAPDVAQSITITTANQTITFAALGDKTFGDADFAVSGTSDSGLALSFAGSGQCTVSGSMVHIISAGSCMVTASQAGSGNYTAAVDVAQSFTIGNSALVTISQSIRLGGDFASDQLALQPNRHKKAPKAQKSRREICLCLLRLFVASRVSDLSPY